MPFQTLTHLSKRQPNAAFLFEQTGGALIGLVVPLAIVSPAWANADKDRRKVAKNLAKEIERAQFHKVYVPDFLDPSGARTEKGCFFASSFSTNLAKDARNFRVVNRIQAQEQLNELHISPQDLEKPEPRFLRRSDQRADRGYGLVVRGSR